MLAVVSLLSSPWPLAASILGIIVFVEARGFRCPQCGRRLTERRVPVDDGPALVEESYYPTACDVAERWLASVVEEEDKRSGLRCPQCRSSHIREHRAREAEAGDAV